MFPDGRESVEIEPWCGELRTVCMVTNIDTVATTIDEDHHLKSGVCTLLFMLGRDQVYVGNESHKVNI